MENMEIWGTNDLVIRYGVSSSKIYKDFLGNGLPYYKDGRRYCFEPDKVKAWEMEKKYIPYGKKGRVVLPEWRRYVVTTKEAIKEAKKRGDKVEVRRLKTDLLEHGYRDDWTLEIAVITLFVAFAIACVLVLR